MAAARKYESATAILSTLSACNSLVPREDDSKAKEDYINSHPLTRSLRSDPNFTESRDHEKIPPAWRRQNLTGGPLMGPGRITIPPFSWTERGGKSYVQIAHIGTDLCGHLGIIHGALPFNVGMTAKLEINYMQPAVANQYLVLRATTVKVEGRKAWVEGHIETLPTGEGQQPTVLTTASALFISPKQASVQNGKGLPGITARKGGLSRGRAKVALLSGMQRL
ncbi:HotDog domain-containing protein [Chaetomium strumarium]|uniref:HotDog domain-containing protein n=1 Tax=Chaetomium strumarium TaxID=1170767 RepID=A0AAJ0GS41_9PEZI|nr:HotDog domain-containing protein [Chaetomium strumarium]